MTLPVPTPPAPPAPAPAPPAPAPVPPAPPAPTPPAPTPPVPPAPPAPTPDPELTPEEQALPANIQEILKKNRAEAAEAKREKAIADAKVAEFEAAGRTELETAQHKAATAEAIAAGLLREAVAATKQLPPSISAALVGSTRAELEAHADRIVADLKAAGVAPSWGGGPTPPPPPAKALAEQIAEAAQKGDWALHGRLNAQLLTEQANK